MDGKPVLFQFVGCLPSGLIKAEDLGAYAEVSLGLATLLNDHSSEGEAFQVGANAQMNRLLQLAVENPAATHFIRVSDVRRMLSDHDFMIVGPGCVSTVNKPI